MNFKERWRIAGYVAQEIRFQSYLEANPLNFSRIKENPERIISQIKTNSSINSIITAIFTLVLGIFILVPLFFAETSDTFELRFALSTSLFFGISLILIFFMNLISTTGFFNAGAMRLPSTLPFHRHELEDLMLLAFLRIFIAPIATLLIIIPILMTFLFGLPAGIFVLAALAATSIIAIGTLIKIAGWFHAKSRSGENSKISVIIRIGAGLGLILGMFAAYSVISIIPLISEVIVTFSLVLGPEVVTLLAFIYPFSFGIVTSVLSHGVIFPLSTITAATFASIVYLILSVKMYLKVGKTLRSLVLDCETSTTIRLPPSFSFDVISPTQALIRKDFNVATRSLGSVIYLVFPTIMIFLAIPILSIIPFETIRSITILLSLGFATGFAGFAVIGILGFDTEGASVYDGLPLETRTVLKGKIVIFALSYIVTMLIVFAILLGRPLISPYIILMPLFQIPCAYSIPAAVGTLVYV
ncbi:MAG: hypothetical protein E4H14_17285, partial [Candidatus Thorarchaeota archaeon]